METIAFRGYRAEDFEAMFALDEICFAMRFRFSRTTMRRFAETQKARVVVADDAGAMAGFCIVHVERAQGGCVGYVVTLDVAPEHRRMGMAGELMRRVEAQVVEAGCVAMVLHVFTGNEGARRFYERSGYVRVGVAEGFYGADALGAGVDAFVYRKVLSDGDVVGDKCADLHR